MAATNYVGRHHNVDADPFDDNGYDLIHARLVLEHLPQREAVVAKLAAALRPGGWLVVQDYDIRTMAVAEPPHDGWQACAHAMPALRSEERRGGQAFGSTCRSRWSPYH